MVSLGRPVVIEPVLKEGVTLPRLIDFRTVGDEPHELFVMLVKADRMPGLVYPGRAESRAAVVAAGAVQADEVDLVFERPRDGEMVPAVERGIAEIGARVQDDVRAVLHRERA